MSTPRSYLRLPAWPVGRWLLVGLVVAGVFGMHVLSAPDNGVGHGMVMTGQTMDSGATQSSAPATPSMQTAEHLKVRSGHAPAPILSSALPSMPDAMAMCLLFLAAAAAAVAMRLFAVGRSDRAAGQRSATRLSLGYSRRGPPRAAPPRIALCILRV